MISRRSLITGFATLLCAPPLVRCTSIMPVKAWEREWISYEVGLGYAITRAAIRNMYAAIEADEIDKKSWFQQREDALNLFGEFAL
jgi:hypothetical protein